MAPKTITTEHKAAITAGRAQNAAIAAYLDALARPARRGRPMSLATLNERHAETVAALDEPLTMVERLVLVQRRLDLEEAIAALEAEEANPLEETEAAFIEHAAAYSDRRGITYAAWRAIGVPAATLRAAGIER